MGGLFRIHGYGQLPGWLVMAIVVVVLAIVALIIGGLALLIRHGLPWVAAVIAAVLVIGAWALFS